MALGTAHHGNQHLIVTLNVFRRIVAGAVTGILIMVFLSDRLHLRCGADHRMIIDCFRINVIINEKPCHIILALLDLLNDGVCVSDCKSPDFFPGYTKVFRDRSAQP